MNDSTIDAQAATVFFNTLREELSDDPRGREILSRFQKSPKKYSQELSDYLYRRLGTDGNLKERLSESEHLPSELRTIINGGQVDKIIQIAEAGTVTIHQGIPIWVGLSAAVITTLAVGLLVFMLIPKPLPPMGNGFNIAVSQFAMIDPNGHVTASDVSNQFSDGLFETVQNEVSSLPPALGIELRQPKDVGIIADDTEAGRVARDIHASLLIYGQVKLDAQGHYAIQPHFYILDTANFNYASEITGPDHLGMPITGLTLDQHGKFKFDTKLNARVQALRKIVLGLAYFYVGDNKSASEEFEKAVSTPDWDEGKEVAYLMLGTAYLRDWDLIRNPDPLADAATSFAEARKLAPQYTRTNLGLGAVALAQAQRSNADHTGIGAVDRNKLNEAIQWYSLGLKEDQPTQAYIPTKSAFGLAQAYLLGYEFHVLDDAKSPSHDYFQQVINKYQDENQNKDLAWYAAHAHAGLGRLAALDSNWVSMSEEYRKAIDILEGIQPYPPKIWIARFWAQAAFAEEKQGHRVLAQDYYQRAIEIGTGEVTPQELSTWQTALEQLKKGNP